MQVLRHPRVVALEKGSITIHVAIDVDGVLADLDGEFRRLLKWKFPEIELPTDAPHAKTWGWTWITSVTLDMEKKVWNSISETPNFWRRLLPYSGLNEQLERLKTISDRHVFSYLTNRRPIGENSNVRYQTQTWLGAYGAPFSENVFLAPRGYKGQLAWSLGCHALIDDHGPNVMDALNYNLATTLLRRPYNEAYVELVRSRGGTVVDDLTEFVDLIMTMTVRQEEWLAGRPVTDVETPIDPNDVQIAQAVQVAQVPLEASS